MKRISFKIYIKYAAPIYTKRVSRLLRSHHVLHDDKSITNVFFRVSKQFVINRYKPPEKRENKKMVG